MTQPKESGESGGPVPAPRFTVSKNKALQSLLATFPDDADIYIDVYEKLCVLVDEVEVACIECALEDYVREREEFEGRRK